MRLGGVATQAKNFNQAWGAPREKLDVEKEMEPGKRLFWHLNCGATLRRIPRVYPPSKKEKGSRMKPERKKTGNAWEKEPLGPGKS